MRARTIAFALLAALLLAGCAGDAPDEEPEPTATPDPEPEEPEHVSLTVRTSGTYPLDPGFDPDTLTVPAGAHVELVFHNDDINSLVDHDWVLEGVTGAATARIGSGEQDAIAFMAPTEPGEYTYYCSVGDHRERGMVGTLVVTA